MPPRWNAATERRQALSEAGVKIAPDLLDGSTGIAFSGGGIRSATISLGVTQALVHEDQLLDFDYCSTVSGGGYFGSFLTSLFLPDWARGPNARARPPKGVNPIAALLDKKKIAFDALSAKARSVNLVNPGNTGTGPIRNPIWWLREHSRYLAPNGPSDYLVAAVYMVRNWLAMIYVMALPIALTALLIIGFDSWFLGDPALVPLKMVEFGRSLTSPLWLLVLLLVFFALTASAAFWSSEAMSNRADRAKPKGAVRRFFDRFATPRTFMSLSSLIGIAVAPALLSLVAPIKGWLTLFSDFADQPPLYQAMAFGSALLALSSLVGLVIVQTTRGDFTGEALIVEARRRITRLNVFFVKAALIIGALALVDTVSVKTYEWLITREGGFGGIWPTLSTALLPVMAWLINKAQEFFKESDSGLLRLIGRWIWTLALVAGLAMFAILAVSVHVGLQNLVFGREAWSDGTGNGFGWPFFVTLIVLFALTVLTGTSTGFINLSSLHGIYAARLTRAYLGATNTDRLMKAASPLKHVNSSIKDSDPLDQIPVDIYQQALHLGPLHLINVTLNETRSAEGSQLLERDRKGVPLVFAPEGVFVNAARERKAFKLGEPRTWAELDKEGVERLSVGQLCAISGAAASTAMGSRTTLGGALALSFANIRLGYWWDVKGLFRQVPRLWSEPFTWIYQKATRPFRTYFYLWNELIANYTRDNARLNLSDGGHFDNSGAYELLRRGVSVIIVCDNGADPDFRFGDLEFLIRKARIDLGLSLEIAAPAQVQAVMGPDALPLFLNGDTQDWRARASARCDRSGPASPDDRAHSLLIEVFGKTDADTPQAHILWMKPRLFADLPQDVIGYALANTDFPHESTANQFFNEAQWESYRALGFAMMMSLLDQGGSSPPAHIVSQLTPKKTRRARSKSVSELPRHPVSRKDAATDDD